MAKTYRRKTYTRRRKTYRRRRTWRKYRNQNPLLKKKVGMYYKTSYTEVYPMVTTSTTRNWCPMTVNMFTQISGSVDSAYFKDANAPQFDTQLVQEKLFDQKKITGVRMKVIVPPAAGSVFTDRNVSTATITAVNI